MKTSLRKLPIEIYLLAAWVAAVFVQLVLSGSVSQIFAYLPRNFIYYSFFGGPFFFAFILAFDLYLIGRILMILTDPLIEKHATTFKASRQRAGRLFREWLLVSAILTALVACTFISTVALNSKFANGDLRPAGASAALMEADRSLFGASPMFVLRPPFGAAFGTPFLLWAYDLLLPAIALFVFYMLVRKPRAVRKFFLAFFVAQLLALPFWYALPALSPYNMYVANSLHQAPPESLAAQISSYRPAAGLTDYFEERYASQQGATDVASFPSMHAAWGVQIGYLGAAEGGLGLIFAPWAVAEMIGAMYNGEHYGVDILAGILVAAASLFIAEGLLALEKRYYAGAAGKDPAGERRFAIGMLLQEDYLAFREWLRRFLKKAAGGR